jgi:hypothetical protein
MTKWRDYSTTNLNTTVTGSSDAGQISISLPYTRRDRSEAAPFSTSYLRIAPGMRAQIGEGETSATFGNLAEFELSSGIAATFNLEWGRNLRPTASEETTVRRELQEARRQCIEHHLSSTAAGNPLSATREDANSGPCEGDNFRRWLSGAGRRNGYYERIARPLWGYDQVPAFFVGFDGSFGWNEYKYFPLSDPAMTGRPLITSLPTEFPKGQTEQSENVYSARFYTGFGFGRSDGWRGTASASLAHRRDFAWASGTRDQQICALPGTPQAPAGFVQCFKRNIAPPYEVEGLVAGLRLRGQSPRLAFFPALAMEVDLTYALEEEQFGIRVPLYFISGTDGTPNGGVVFSCRSEGETRTGFALQSECTAGLFVSSSFRLGGR